MGKHEATEEGCDVPEIHIRHVRMRNAVREAFRCVRDVLIGGTSIILFEWARVGSPISPKGEALEVIVRVISS